MLRGAIDYTSPNRIGGWIYSETAPLYGHTVLAFLDNFCVGSGTVEIFRQDLFDAGLGDGKLGFNFRISIPESENVERVVVKLENSDAALIQPSARIESSNPSAHAMLIGSMPRIEWMRARGWLEQFELDFLRSVSQAGVYDMSLRRTKSAERVAGSPLLDPAQTAQQLLSLAYLDHLQPMEKEAEDGQEALLQLQNPRNFQPLAAIWSSKQCPILVVEASHEGVKTESRSMEGAVEYKCGPDRLLFMDLRCQFAIKLDRQQPNFKIFTVPTQASSNL